MKSSLAETAAEIIETAVVEVSLLDEVDVMGRTSSTLAQDKHRMRHQPALRTIVTADAMLQTIARPVETAEMDPQRVAETETTASLVVVALTVTIAKEAVSKTQIMAVSTLLPEAQKLPLALDRVDVERLEARKTHQPVQQAATHQTCNHQLGLLHVAVDVATGTSMVTLQRPTWIGLAAAICLHLHQAPAYTKIDLAHLAMTTGTKAAFPRALLVPTIDTVAVAADNLPVSTTCFSMAMDQTRSPTAATNVSPLLADKA